MALSMERLENRVLLAVSLTRSGGTLHILGGATPEILRITGDALPGVVHVDADNDLIFERTLTGVASVIVDSGAGHDAVIVDASKGRLQLTGDLTIRSGNGRDDVDVAGAILGDDLSIDSGLQDDVIRLTDNRIADAVVIRSGSGAAQLDLNTLDIGGSLSISTGSIDDSLLLAANQVRGAAVIRTRGGNDEVLFDSNQFGSDVSVFAGAGDDYVESQFDEIGRHFGLDLGAAVSGSAFSNAAVVFDTDVGGDLMVQAAAGSDHVEIDGSRVTRDLKIQLGAGDAIALVSNGTSIGRDAVLTSAAGADLFAFFGGALGAVRVQGRLTVDVGSGADRIEAEDLFVGGQFQLSAGAGDDIVDLGDIPAGGAPAGDVQVVGPLLVNLGSGDDLMTVSDTDSFGTVMFDGGQGRDTGNLLADVNFAILPSRRNFELGNLV